jgi:heme/copper-type cytochrome/quinol oxidase subunit 3
MNSNSYIVSGIIAFVFLVAKFLEMRFSGANNVVDNEGEEAPQSPKPLKFLLRDTLLVYMSSLLGFYVISQFEEHVATNAVVKEVAAFTGGPDF